MGCGFTITELEDSETRVLCEPVGPAGLKKIEVVNAALALETTRQNERWRHAAAGQRLEVYGYSPIIEVDARAAVEGVELIPGAGPDARANVPKQQPAALIVPRKCQWDSLQRPLRSAHDEKVGPFCQRPSGLYAVPGEPAKLLRLLHHSSIGRRRQI